MSSKTKLLIVLTGLFLFATPAWATEWYVDDEDSNNWNNLSQIVWGSGGVQAGDTIYVCTNEPGRTVIGADNITFKPCPNKPIKNLNTKRTVTGIWTDLGDGRYRFAYGAGVNSMLEDGHYLKKASDTNLTDGNWIQDAGQVYYRPTSGTPDDHTVETVLWTFIIHTNGHDNLVFDGLHFAYGPWGINADHRHGRISGGNNITIKNCSFYNMRNGGIQLRGDSGEVVSNVLVEHNTFRHCGEGVVIGGTSPVSGITIRNNYFYDIHHTHDGMDWHDAGSLTDQECIGIQSGTNIVIEHNLMEQAYKGIVAFGVWGQQFKDVLIHHNTIKDAMEFGIMMSGANTALPSNNLRVMYNYVTGRGAEYGDSSAGCLCVKLEANTPNEDDSMFLNNTVENCYASFRPEYNSIGGGKFYNNLSINPEQYHIRASSTSGNFTMDHNIYVGSAQFQHYPETKYDLSGWQTLSGQDGNSTALPSLPMVSGHIKYGSPAIDAGNRFATHDSALDIDLESIVDNPDVGCDEYHQANFRTDVNNDSQANSTDALLTLRHSLGLSMTDTDWQESSITGDANCDGTTNSTDALLILRYSLGLDMNGTGWCGG